MIKTIKESDEVLYPKEDIVMLGYRDLNTLKQLAKLNPRRRIRLCTHENSKDEIHEMIIFHPKNTYVPPHKHLNKDESFHLICGEIDCVIFNNKGDLKRTFPMGDYSSGKTFYYRIPANTFHTQIFKKDTFFHEVTNGPFNRNDSITASWAPEEIESTLAKSYIADIKDKIKSINN